MGKVKVEIPVNEVITTETFTKEQWDGGSAGQRAAELRKKYVSKGYENVKVTRKIVPSSPNSSGTTITINNPLKGAPSKAAFALKTQPKPQYYLQFGYLLQYVRDNILLKVKVGDNHSDNPPIFDIDFDQWSNHMYSLPNQISLDPRVCVVRNDNFNNGQTSTPTKIFSNLYVFKEIDNGSSQNDNAAYIMNVYLNFNFIIECLKTDERGDVNVFEFIKSICDGINKALGGINNLEPIIEETSNTLKIIDTTPIPGYSGIDGTKKYTLQLYGYDKLGTSYISNFIRKVDLKTAITPEFATMITVGATAGGYVKGVEATAFSRWNYGLTDRFKEEFTPGNIASVTPTGSVDEAEVNYVNKFLLNNGYITRYGFPSFSGADFKLSDDIIEGNISVGTEYFKYIVAKNQSSSGGTIGFIPFKISFTMDGLSGIKIYNKLNVNTRFLPRAYGNNLDLIVTGVSHKLANNDWETDIEATVIPKTKLSKTSFISGEVIQQSIEQVKSAPGGKKKGKDITPKDPNKICGLTNAKNVNQTYPRSTKWYGTSQIIVAPSNPPKFVVNLNKQPIVKFSKTIVTPRQYVKDAENIIDKLAPNAKSSYKKAILTSAFAISRQEQGGPGGGFKGFNNNISGIEASGFSVYSASDVVGKVILTEGGTGKKKEYYAFKDIGAGLVPLLSKIMERNMWATGGTPNEFAWRYFRDWNGYGARTTQSYAKHMDDCILISNFENIYKSALSQVNQFSKYK